MPAIPQLPTIDPTVLVILGIVIGAYVLWFAWGVMSAEVPDDPYIKARKQKPTAVEQS
jgi:threonine/homoserine/homoserine lactone efflux protein